MHMHVTAFSAATILVFAIASPLHAQGIEVFGGYSVNADYVQNRPAILVVDQKVSPFFSLGSGPAGFEASFKQDVRNGLGIKVDVSGYSDTFPPGPRGVLPTGQLHCRDCLRHRPDVSGYRPRVVCDRRSRVEDPARQAVRPLRSDACRNRVHPIDVHDERVRCAIHKSLHRRSAAVHQWRVPPGSKHPLR